MPKLNSINLIKILGDKNIRMFSILDVVKLFDISYNNARRFIYRNVENEIVDKVKNGLYFLKDNRPHNFFIANKTYIPSYISLETALSYYHIIPETIYSVTSITSKSTREFNYGDIIFSYQKIKKNAFTGYFPVKMEGDIVLMAEPEKALADYLYFVSLGKKSILERIDFSLIDVDKLRRYIKLFNHKSLNKLIEKYDF